MKKVFLKAGDALSLDLNIIVSIPRSLSFDEDELKSFIENGVRKFLSDPVLVNFDEVC